MDSVSKKAGIPVMSVGTNRKNASVPADLHIQYGQTGGVCKRSNVAADNSGPMISNNITINTSTPVEMHLGSTASLRPVQVETTTLDAFFRCLGPNLTSSGVEATPGNSDSFRSTGTLEPTVQEVIKKIDRMSGNKEISLQKNKCFELIDIGVPYRMGAKHNIEKIVLIAEKNPSKIHEIYFFLHKKRSNITNFGAPCDKPVKDVISHAANPLCVIVDVSKLDNALIRLLTQQSVDNIVYIAIFQPETMRDISEFLLGYFSSLQADYGYLETKV